MGISIKSIGFSHKLEKSGYDLFGRFGDDVLYMAKNNDGN